MPATQLEIVMNWRAVAPTAMWPERPRGTPTPPVPDVYARLAVARRCHTASALRDDTIVVAGGLGDGDAPLDSTELISPAGEVRPGPRLPSPRFNHSALVLDDGSLVVVGGTAQAVDRFDGERWRRCAELPLLTSDPAFAVLEGTRVLAVGGYSGDRGYSPDAAVYDARRDRWTPIGGLARGRGEHAAISLRDGRVVVVGGCMNDGAPDVEIYDPRSERWTSVPMPQVRRRVAVATAHGNVLVLGGAAGAHQALLFDPMNETWAGFDRLHGGYRRVTAVELPDDRVYVLDGVDASLLDGHTWHELVSPAPYRTDAAVVARRTGEVLVIGGYNWNGKRGAIADGVTIASFATPDAAEPAAAAPRVKRVADVPARGVKIVEHWRVRAEVASAGRTLIGPALAGKRAAWGAGQVKLHDLDGKVSPRALSGSKGMEHIALGKRTVVAAGSGLTAWDARTGEQLWTHDEYDEDGTYMLAISPDGSLVVTGGEDRTVRAFAARTGKLAWTVETYKMVWSGAFSRDGKRVAIGDWGGHLFVVDTATGKTKTSASIPMMPAALAFVPSGKQLIMGIGHFEEHFALSDTEQPLSIIDTKTGDTVRVIDDYTHGFGGVAILGDDHFVTACHDGTVRVHALRDGAEVGRLDLAPLEDLPTGLAIDGETILVATLRGTVLRLARASG